MNNLDPNHYSDPDLFQLCIYIEKGPSYICILHDGFLWNSVVFEIWWPETKSKLDPLGNPRVPREILKSEVLCKKIKIVYSVRI
jgi:hypothetical protein